MSWSGLSRPSIYHLAQVLVDVWILGTSPRMTGLLCIPGEPNRLATSSRARQKGRRAAAGGDLALDVVEVAADGLGAGLDELIGAMEVEQAAVGHARLDDHVRRIAGKAGARNAVLHDVEGLHHHAGDAGAVVGAAEELALQKLFYGAAVAGQQALRLSGGVGFGREFSWQGLEVGDHRASPAKIRVDADGDHIACTERATDRDGNGVDQRAVEQPAPLDGYGAE